MNADTVPQTIRGRSLRRRLVTGVFVASMVLSLTHAAHAQDSGSSQRPKPLSDAEARQQVHARMIQSSILPNQILQRVSGALKLWQQGHHREAYTIVLLAHRELNSLFGTQGNHNETPAFDLTTGLYLAQMSDEIGESVEAYNLYHRIMHPPHPEMESFDLRPDILLSYSELCTRLGKPAEAKRAFDQIAKGDAFTTYLTAAEDAMLRVRLGVAERWMQKALELRPNAPDALEQKRTLALIKGKVIGSGIG